MIFDSQCNPEQMNNARGIATPNIKLGIYPKDLTPATETPGLSLPCHSR